MERELWPRIYHGLRRAAGGTLQRGVTYQPRVIAAVLIRAALHDRPAGWVRCRTGCGGSAG